MILNREEIAPPQQELLNTLARQPEIMAKLFIQKPALRSAEKMKDALLKAMSQEELELFEHTLTQFSQKR